MCTLVPKFEVGTTLYFCIFEDLTFLYPPQTHLASPKFTLECTRGMNSLRLAQTLHRRNLLVPINWQIESFSPTNRPVRKCTYQHRSKNRPRIVHVVLGNRKDLRERHPQHYIENVAQRKNVDRYTKSTHFERTERGSGAAQLP